MKSPFLFSLGETFVVELLGEFLEFVHIDICVLFISPVI